MKNPPFIWAACADAMPPDREMVLIHNPAWMVEETWMGFYDGASWISGEGLWLVSAPHSGKSDAAPTHWMTLPPPPVAGWSPDLDGLAHVDPQCVCTEIKCGRVQLRSSGQLVTLSLSANANLSPMAVAILSVDEAIEVAGSIVSSAIAARHANAIPDSKAADQ